MENLVRRWVNMAGVTRPTGLQDWEHQLRDDADFRRHIDYIHWNPVKHGYVRRVAAFDISSVCAPWRVSGEWGHGAAECR